ncbi:NUDIX hydrolase [Glycomyces buryatensis]|nr:NUDIX domain-containing protein [Glycomyces buryatensis]
MNAAEPPPLVLRRCARVLVADEDDRVLFNFSSGAVSPESQFFDTIGGGIDADETPPEAAARELFEETGLRVEPADLGPVVAHTAGEWWAGPTTRIYQDDTYFFLRTPHFTPTFDYMEEGERRSITSAEWLTVSQLDTIDHAVFPVPIATLVKQLIGGDLPTEPVELTWVNWTGVDKRCPVPE